VRRRANRLESIYEIGSVFQSMHLRLFDSIKRRQPGREQKFSDSDSWAFVEPKPIGSGRPTTSTSDRHGPVHHHQSNAQRHRRSSNSTDKAPAASPDPLTNMCTTVREQVQQQLSRDRKTIADEESARARQQVYDELQTQKSNLEQQTRRIETLTQKLTAAQAAEADLLKKEQELGDKEREFALNLQKGIAAGLEQARANALREAHANLDLRMQDRENTISQLKKQITSLQRKAEQRSEQAQGEVLELALEHQLRTQFPFDLIEPVGKGKFGGDILQHVRDHKGQLCGKILWESKRTTAWSDGWLTKLKKDQRNAHAELAVIVSQTMPKDIVLFEQLDGVWVSSLSCILPVASALTSPSALPMKYRTASSTCRLSH
jgi:hypothetical protein